MGPIFLFLWIFVGTLVMIWIATNFGQSIFILMLIPWLLASILVGMAVTKQRKY